MLADTFFHGQWWLDGIVWTRKQYMWVASTHSRAGLIKLEKNKDGFFMDSAWSAKPQASWRWDPARPHKVSYEVKPGFRPRFWQVRRQVHRFSGSIRPGLRFFAERVCDLLDLSQHVNIDLTGLWPGRRQIVSRKKSKDEVADHVCDRFNLI